MSDYVHGGTDEREVARLQKQAGFVAAWALPRFDAAPGMRVLDLATGVGAMAAQLLARFPGIELVGVDLSASQLRAAHAGAPHLRLARADAARLPFPDASFDRVHCSWLLEHLRQPAAVLREVRRVLRPGGSCTFFEVDNASFRVTPPLPEVDALLRAMDMAQTRAGGDAWVGHRLPTLFRSAGFDRFTIEPVGFVGSAADPVFQRAFLEEFAEIFESLDEVLGPELHHTIVAAAAHLRSLPERPDGVIRYSPRMAKGFVQGTSLRHAPRLR